MNSDLGWYSSGGRPLGLFCNTGPPGGPPAKILNSLVLICLLFGQLGNRSGDWPSSMFFALMSVIRPGGRSMPVDRCPIHRHFHLDFSINRVIDWGLCLILCSAFLHQIPNDSNDNEVEPRLPIDLVDVRGVGISTKSYSTCLDVVSLLNPMNCKDNDFSTSYIWTSSSFFNSKNKISSEDINSIGFEKMIN